jgi:hypothetical protein
MVTTTPKKSNRRKNQAREKEDFASTALGRKGMMIHH